MAEEIPTDPQQAAQQNFQLVIDERDLRTIYSNSYRIHATADEVVVDLSFNMPDPNPQQGQQPRLILKISDRVVLSYLNAKRLALSLGQLVKRYEQQFGELVPPGQRPPQR